MGKKVSISNAELERKLSSWPKSEDSFLPSFYSAINDKVVCFPFIFWLLTDKISWTILYLLLLFSLVTTFWNVYIFTTIETGPHRPKKTFSENVHQIIVHKFSNSSGAINAWHTISSSSILHRFIFLWIFHHASYQTFTSQSARLFFSLFYLLLLIHACKSVSLFVMC